MGKKIFLISILIVFVSCGMDLNDANGFIEKDTVWSGEITVTGDIVVAEGVLLTIEPGSVITVMARQDVAQMSHLGEADNLTADDPMYTEEFEKSRITFLVLGEISCRGTFDKPIVFKSSAEEPFYDNWIGFTVKKGYFDYTCVSWCRDGIGTMPNHEGLNVHNSVVAHTWASGINIQIPYNSECQSDIKSVTIKDCGHEAIDTHDPGLLTVRQTFISGSQAGPNLNGHAEFVFENCIVVDTTWPIMVNEPSSSSDIFISHCNLNAQIQSKRWIYEGFSIPQQIGDYAINVKASASATKFILLDTAIFDCSYGLFIESGASINPEIDYINFDGVVSDSTNPVLGSNCSYESSGFLDKAKGYYELSSSSALIGSGKDGDSIGAYDGSGLSIGAPATVLNLLSD
ncbi:MAG: hypothetical protein JXR63_02535 [Spirochaetales bacterium]|nr:hypothetical protein [Spirochaetales bacterium]